MLADDPHPPALLEPKESEIGVDGVSGEDGGLRHRNARGEVGVDEGLDDVVG
jgi:hypothetical protein